MVTWARRRTPFGSDGWRSRERPSAVRSKPPHPKANPASSSTSEILETAFKKETVGLVTRAEYVEKRVNIKNKIEEEEKEKLLKLQKEEEELQLQKLKKRKIKADPRLSFADDFEMVNEVGDVEDSKSERHRSRTFGKLGKDPTVETIFLPDRLKHTLTVRERQRKKPNVNACGNSGFLSRHKSKMSLFKLLTTIGMVLAIDELFRFGKVIPLGSSFVLFSSSSLLLNHERCGLLQWRICFM